MIRESILGEPAEIEWMFSSDPYGTIGRELEVDYAVIKGLGSNSDGLGLTFWAETPSGKFEESLLLI